MLNRVMTFGIVLAVSVGAMAAEKPASKKKTSEANVLPHRVAIALDMGLSAAKKKEVVEALKKKFPGLKCARFDGRMEVQQVRVPKGMSLNKAIREFARVKGVTSVKKIPLGGVKQHGRVVLMLFEKGTTSEQRKKTVGLIKGAKVKSDWNHVNGCAAILPTKVTMVEALLIYAYAPRVKSVEPDSRIGGI